MSAPGNAANSSAAEGAPPVKNHNKYRKEKPWDHDGIDHWKIEVRLGARRDRRSASRSRVDDTRSRLFSGRARSRIAAPGPSPTPAGVEA